MTITLKPWVAFVLAAIFILSAAALQGCATGERDAFWGHNQRMGH